MASFPLRTSPRRIAAGLVLVASFTIPLAEQDPAIGATGTVIHVAHRGNDNASGSQAHPLATISAAVRRAVPGTTIIVGPGTYHESVTLQGISDVTIEQPQERRSGSTGARGCAVGHDAALSGSRRAGDTTSTPVPPIRPVLPTGAPLTGLSSIPGTPWPHIRTRWWIKCSRIAPGRFGLEGEGQTLLRRLPVPQDSTSERTRPESWCLPALAPRRSRSRRPTQQSRASMSGGMRPRYR